MARWCPNRRCSNHNVEVAGTPMKCASCKRNMSVLRPKVVATTAAAPAPVALPTAAPGPGPASASVAAPVAAPAVPRYLPRRLAEMDDAAWAHYQQRVVVNKSRHDGRSRAVLRVGKPRNSSKCANRHPEGWAVPAEPSLENVQQER